MNEGDFRSTATADRWALIVTVLRDVAAGMDYMHGKRLCHGDLNPANILLKVRVCRCLCTWTMRPVSAGAVPLAARVAGW